MNNSTEAIGDLTGPKMAGFIASFTSNVAELILGIIGLTRHDIDMTRLSYVGSIVNNCSFLACIALLVYSLRMAKQVPPAKENAGQFVPYIMKFVHLLAAILRPTALCMFYPFLPH